MPLEPSSYADPFARDHLPPEALWPQMVIEALMARLLRHYNAADSLLASALARGFGPRPAVSGGDITLTYAQLDEHANRIAAVLRDDYGLVPGNRVLLRGANTPMLAAAWFGVLKAGGIAVTTMPLLRARELGQIIDGAQISHALCDARIKHDLVEAAVGTALKHIGLYHSDLPDGLEARMEGKPARFAAFQPSRDDVALIAFTSGTTGKPKATVHFHRDIAAICETVPTAVLKPQPDDVFTGSAPLGFTYGLGSLLLFPLTGGASTVFVERATPEAMLAAIRAHRVTTLLTGPTLYRTMLEHWREGDTDSLKLCCSSGEHLPASLQMAWRERTGLMIRNILGATEMLHAFIATPDEGAKPGSLGAPLPGYVAQVVDNDGKPVPPGVIGRLAVRGPTGCRYLADEARQKIYVQHGWNITGDAFSADDDGTLWYHARSDDMIVSSGYNISGPEIEEVLLEHPAVAMCCVVGVPDPARGAIAKAFVVPKNPQTAGPELAAELQDYVKATLAPYKYPRAVEFIAELPMTTTGKVQRSALVARG